MLTSKVFRNVYVLPARKFMGGLIIHYSFLAPRPLISSCGAFCLDYVLRLVKYEQVKVNSVGLGTPTDNYRQLPITEFTDEITS